MSIALVMGGRLRSDAGDVGRTVPLFDDEATDAAESRLAMEPMLLGGWTLNENPETSFPGVAEELPVKSDSPFKHNSGAKNAGEPAVLARS